MLQKHPLARRTELEQATLWTIRLQGISAAEQPVLLRRSGSEALPPLPHAMADVVWPLQPNTEQRQADQTPAFP